MEDRDDSQWFVAQLRPQGLVRAQAHLHRQGFETFAPDILVTTTRAGAARETRKPLFPGYLFVSFDPDVSKWGVINSTRGIAKLMLSDPRRPQPLPSTLMTGLRQRCDASGLLTSQMDLSVGDRIRVLSGPFADLVTTIETLPSAARIGILIDLMGRKVRTTLSSDQILKLD
jgi:transcriptional antiterminator RfaH